MRLLVRAMVRALIRAYPFYRGGVRLAHMALPRRLTQDGSLVLTRLRCGPDLLVHLNDYCGRAIYYWGDYDRKITWICRRLLRCGDCFLDVGGGYGEVGMCAARFVGPSGQVHIFEPQQRLAEYIRMSAELNGFRNVETHAVALSDRDGEADLFIPRGNRGCASLVKPDTGAEPTLVQVRQGTRYLTKLGLPPIRLMKLDVEGHEEEVLSGALDLLDANRPTAIVFESYKNQPFFERGEVRLMARLGYRFLQIRQRNLFRVQLRALRDSGHVENGYDFVALSTNSEGQDASRLLPIA